MPSKNAQWRTPTHPRLLALRFRWESAPARDLAEGGSWDGIPHLWDVDGPIESLISDRIGCRTFSADRGDLDLASICRA